MRVLITSSTGELPQDVIAYASRKAQTEYIKRTGTPEIIHPPNFWEIIVTDVKKPFRLTSHPYFKPIYHRDDLKGYDYDHPLDTLTINALFILGGYWRPSTTCHGVHILTKQNEIMDATNDPTREEATILRGYEWFWEVKQSNKAFQWNQICSQMDLIKLLGYQNRKFKLHDSRFYSKRHYQI